MTLRERLSASFARKVRLIEPIHCVMMGVTSVGGDTESEDRGRTRRIIGIARRATTPFL
jgi:hypothetical protein